MKTATKIGAIVIILAAITLSGCDAILEGFYPEETDRFGGGGGEYGIGINVQVTVPQGDFESPMIAAKVEDISNSEWITDAFVVPDDNLGPDGERVLTGYVQLLGVPEGDFRVIVWLERTANNMGNDYPDFDEPQRNAVWFTSDKDTEGKDVFSFPNDPGWSWIDGVANLTAFEGPGVNRDFDIGGQRVLTTAELSGVTQYDTRDYQIYPADTANAVTDIWYTLWKPDGSTLGGYAWVSDVPEFSIDYSALLEGYYWLEVEVRYSDDWYESKGFPIRILSQELGAGVSYTVNVTVDNMSGWPTNVGEGESVDYEYRVVDTYGNIVISSGGAVGSFVSNGMVQFGTGVISYSQSPYNGSGVDWLEIDIDVDPSVGNGADYYFRYPLGVSSNDFLPLDLYLWSEDLRPIYN